jgi:hypothetical protein
VKRYFCGFCGTPLTSWSERPREEADWISVSLNSLESASLDLLGERGILPSSDAIVDDDQGEAPSSSAAVPASKTGRDIAGPSWFEEILEGSALSRLRRRRGGQTSADGKIRTEWEVIEFESGGGGSAPDIAGGKRKLGDLSGADDVVMREGH